MCTDFTDTRDKRPNTNKVRFQIADDGAGVTFEVFQNTKAAPELSALTVLHEKKPKYQNELAEMLGIGESTISGWINKLCEKGVDSEEAA